MPHCHQVSGHDGPNNPEYAGRKACSGSHAVLRIACRTELTQGTINGGRGISD